MKQFDLEGKTIVVELTHDGFPFWSVIEDDSLDSNY